MLNPIDLNITERLKDHSFAVEYVAALEEGQRDSDRRYEKRIADLQDRIKKLEGDNQVLRLQVAAKRST